MLRLSNNKGNFMKINLDLSKKQNKNKKQDLLQVLEHETVLSRFKAPFNAYALLLAAGFYNISNIIYINGIYDPLYVMTIFIREMAAASIGVYGLARLYYIFVDSVTKRLLWYFLIVTAAFNFGTFVNISTQWVESFLRTMLSTID